jgi:hypothetical protein
MQRLLWVLALTMLLAGGLFAQQTQLSGTVTDPTGAVIPNATLSLVSNTTGATREGTADSEGRYSFLQVTPGTYKLTAKAAGFSDVVVNNIELQVNSPATVPIVFEKLGATSTTVSVEASAVQVNTVDATLGNAISTQAIQQLPFFARNITGLLAIQPGVSFTGDTSSARSGAVNGGKPDQANVTLDGVDVNNQNNRAAFTSVLRVTLDSVEEFRTTTTGANADQGRSSGAQIALITRSGTNELHGAAYEYHRNTVTAANDWFNNRNKVARPALLINVFGMRFGGPIIKNRTFGFFNYEGRRDRSAANAPVRIVPTDAYRAGNLTYLSTTGVKVLSPAEVRTIVDPAGIGGNAAALALFNQFPRANDLASGDGLNFAGYRFTAPVASDQNTYIAKFDHRLDANGRHQVFVRGNLQNDSVNGVPQFPGLPPNSVTLNNSKGMAAGYTAVLKDNLVSTFRYGYTRFGGETTGVQVTPVTTFRTLSAAFGTTLGNARIIPVHNVTEDFAWTKGAHDVRFGGTLRFIRNGSTNFANSFSSASTNSSWLQGTGSDLTPTSLGLASSFITSYRDAAMALLGIVSQVNARYNFKVDGTVLASGAPVVRKYANEEYEFYVQDSYKLKRNLTITLGVRVGVMPAVYEANGQQISPNIPFDTWLNTRGQLASQGLSQTGAGVISFLANARPLYPNHINTAPRIAIAYSPNGQSGLSKFLFGGPGKSSIRVGAGMFYDLIGQPLAQTYDASAFGLQTTLTNSSGIQTSRTAPRFTSFFTIPQSLARPAPPGGFPATYPDLFAITNSIDDNLKAPYTINLNFSVSREFGKGLFFQASYVGRLSRHSLLNRDLAMPTDMKDPKSGQTYFQAASAVASYLQRNSTLTKAQLIAGVPTQQFFENMWKTAATTGRTATQNIAQDAIENSSLGRDMTTTLTDMDLPDLCNPGGTLFSGSGLINALGCGVQGPNMIFNNQFSALSAWSSIGKGSYHSFQFTMRKRFAQGLTADFNYTLGKSIDLGSSQENAGSFSGFVQNTWDVSQMRGVSNYDTLHIANAFAVWEIPVGKGRRFMGNSNKVMNALLGGWQITGTYTQTSGFPISIGNGRLWPTNWNITPTATPNGLPQQPTTNNHNAPLAAGTGSSPNLWDNPAAQLAAFTFTLPGQSGSRNTIRGGGNFDISTGVGKRWIMPYKESHTVQLRWEAFNLLNAVRFDPATASATITTGSSFGNHTSTLTNPRQMQFALRYEF